MKGVDVYFVSHIHSTVSCLHISTLCAFNPFSMILISGYIVPYTRAGIISLVLLAAKTEANVEQEPAIDQSTSIKCLFVCS